MQQRQLRLGDILDDYCPRERRLTNHVVVAMIGPDVKQTRCTTCDAEHPFKHAKVPRPRRKTDTPPALYAPGTATPKRHEPGASPDLRPPVSSPSEMGSEAEPPPEATEALEVDDAVGEVAEAAAGETDVPPDGPDGHDQEDEGDDRPDDEGPVHRPLIRASLPRPEGQPPPARPVPEFTIRQPGGRQNRFRPRHQRGGDGMFGNRSNGPMSGGFPRGGGQRQTGGRPPGMPRVGKRHGPGHKRSK